jgi:protoheme IX farnesyltransferase
MQTKSIPTMKLLALFRLVRLPLAAMVALSALAAALASGAHVTPLTLQALTWGVFLLAAASSVLNQVQERFTDGLMWRTCHRPLASGVLSSGVGTGIGLMLASGGLAVLLVGTNLPTTLLGLTALAWYLAVYTPLKRVTSLAVLAGTPCGSLPPLMGWLASGGDISAPQAFILPLLILLWQVPHYWLLALPDRAELKSAGFRVLPKGLSDRQLLMASHQWILGVSATTLLLPLLQLVMDAFLQGLLYGLAAALAIGGTWLCKRALFIDRVARKLRIGLHVYLAVVLLVLLLDQALIRLALAA